MRLVATEYLTLDGVFAEPGHWSFPYFNEQAAKFKSDELEATEALLVAVKFDVWDSTRLPPLLVQSMVAE